MKSDLFPNVPFSWNPLKFQELEERVRSTREATICALNQMLDLKDLNTGVHSTRLAEWAVRVGQELGMEESGLADIEVAALLHDAGKVGVPDSILKKPGPLDPDEWRVMRMHPEFSWAVLRLVPGLEKASLYALHHHEKFNGGGYPSGLKGEEIPIGSRIVSVIDAFDAMVASRPYKEGLPLEEALSRLVRDSGTHFDPAVVAHFIPIARAEMPSVFAATGVSQSTELSPPTFLVDTAPGLTIWWRTLAIEHPRAVRPLRSGRSRRLRVPDPPAPGAVVRTN